VFTGAVERALGREGQPAEDRGQVNDVALLLLLNEGGREGGWKRRREEG